MLYLQSREHRVEAGQHGGTICDGHRPVGLRVAWGARLQNMLGPTHIGEVARGAGTPRSGGAAERRLDGIAYVARREQFL